MTTVEPPPEDPMIRWRNYQHLIWSQQQIHLQIQQQQLLQHEANNNNLSNGKNEESIGPRLNPPPLTKAPPNESPEENAKDIADPWEQVDVHSAFLGPTLWDKRLPYDGHDFKVGKPLEYVDLEEFLTENGIPVDEHGKHLNLPLGPPPPALRRTTPDPPPPVSAFPLPPPFYPGGRNGHGGYVISHHDNGTMASDYSSSSPSPSPSTSSMSQDMTNDSSSAPLDQTSVPGHEFDPRIRLFSTDELKPQPMIKKSKKQYVPDDAKDAKYWMRRRKNNLAAKRSRDARRVKENQIAMRACYLEKENQFIKQELERVQKENSLLKEQLTRFTYSEPPPRR